MGESGDTDKEESKARFRCRVGRQGAGVVDSSKRGEFSCSRMQIGLGRRVACVRLGKFALPPDVKLGPMTRGRGRMRIDPREATVKASGKD